MFSPIRVGVLVVLVEITLTGCSTIYSGPPEATVQDFMKARTECYVQLKTTSATGAVGIYGGYLLKRPSVNCAEWRGCLASKGYARSLRGRFKPSELGAEFTGCERTVG